MEEGAFKILTGKLTGKRPLGRRRGRPRNSWMQEVTTRMREKEINSMECIDREEWKRKRKLKL